MSTMIQVFLDAPRSIAMEERPIPTPEPHQVLVKIMATGICATDVHSYYGETIHGKRFPFHIGHEIAGVVAAKGGNVRGLEPGDRVVLDPLVTCGECPDCRSGHSNRCERIRPLGLHGPGGFSGYTVIDARNAYRFSGIDDAEMTFAEPLSTVLNAVHGAGITPDMRVLVQGAGTLGLLFLQVVKKSLGCARVAVGDISIERLALAERFGAEILVMPIDPEAVRAERMRFDIVIDCTGNAKAVQDAVPLLADGGTLVIFGVCPHNARIELSPFDIYRRELKIMGSFALNKNMEEAVALLQSGTVHCSPLIGGIIPMRDLESTIQGLHDRKLTGRFVAVHSKELHT